MTLNGIGNTGIAFYTVFKIGSPDLTKIKTLDDVDLIGKPSDWSLHVDGYHRSASKTGEVPFQHDMEVKLFALEMRYSSSR